MATVKITCTTEPSAELLALLKKQGFELGVAKEVTEEDFDLMAQTAVMLAELEK